MRSEVKVITTLTKTMVVIISKISGLIRGPILGIFANFSINLSIRIRVYSGSELPKVVYGSLVVQRPFPDDGTS